MSAAWFFAASPIKRSPSLKATTDGVMRLPWSLAMISTRPLTYTPTHCGSGNTVEDRRDLRAASTAGVAAPNTWCRGQCRSRCPPARQPGWSPPPGWQLAASKTLRGAVVARMARRLCGQPRRCLALPRSKPWRGRHVISDRRKSTESTRSARNNRHAGRFELKHLRCTRIGTAVRCTFAFFTLHNQGRLERPGSPDRLATRT